MAHNLLIAAFVVLVIWGLRRMFPAQPKALNGLARQPGQPRAHQRRYEAVSIHSYRDRCGAAKRLAGIRFLPSEVPSLPLHSCRTEQCHCIYMHHSDRRTGNERRLARHHRDVLRPTLGFRNRRHDNGRRAGDPAVA